MERYSVLKDKNPREIVLLRGSGCKWKRCTFCDYHLDYCLDEEDNYNLNAQVLSKVTGIYNKLEVINSGSFCDLDNKTMDLIIKTCEEKNISTVHFEKFKEHNINVRIKTGVETFDVDYRENVMKKGFGKSTPEKIRTYADEVCLLFGLTGQTESSMKNDIETGLKYFDRVCVNIMNDNTTNVKPDNSVIKVFAEKIAPNYIGNDRVDILMKNTDFGVGGESEEQTND